MYTCDSWVTEWSSEMWKVVSVEKFNFDNSESFYRLDRLHSYIQDIYQTLLSKATYSNSYIHSYTHTHQEQFGVQHLAQGHFDMQTRESNPDPQPPPLLPDVSAIVFWHYMTFMFYLIWSAVEFPQKYNNILFIYHLTPKITFLQQFNRTRPARSFQTNMF